MKIYTKTGDKGTTALVGGARVSKDSAQLETYGTIDELNAQTGLAMEMLSSLALASGQAGQRDEMVCQLLAVQNRLFTVGSILATEVGKWEEHWQSVTLADWTSEMELLIDRYTAELPAWKGFILPSGSVTAAQLHVCRTVCRRAERNLCHFSAENDMKGIVFERVLQYVNRLSDFYFILARKELQIENKFETIWKSEK